MTQAYNGENFILFPESKGSMGLYDKIIEFCKNADFEPNVVQEAYELEVILGLVSEGVGVALVPENSGNLYLKFFKVELILMMK